MLLEIETRIEAADNFIITSMHEDFASFKAHVNEVKRISK